MLGGPERRVEVVRRRAREPQPGELHVPRPPLVLDVGHGHAGAAHAVADAHRAAVVLERRQVLRRGLAGVVAPAARRRGPPGTSRGAARRPVPARRRAARGSTRDGDTAAASSAARGRRRSTALGWQSCARRLPRKTSRSHVRETWTSASRRAWPPTSRTRAGPVFALTSLPEVVKGALFARYSRSPSRFAACCSTSSCRRARRDGDAAVDAPSARRAPRPSTSACSRSTATTRWPSSAAPTWRWRAPRTCSPRCSSGDAWRATSSSRRATSPTPTAPAARFRYHRPAGGDGPPRARPRVRGDARRGLRRLRRAPAAAGRARGHRVPGRPATPPPRATGPSAPRPSTCCAGCCPRPRPPTSGIFASGQAYEAMLVRMRAHPLPEARECAASMLRELRKVIPAFLTRVDRADRGVAHGAYLARARPPRPASAARPARPRPTAGDGAGGAPGGLRPRRRGPRPGRTRCGPPADATWARSARACRRCSTPSERESRAARRGPASARDRRQRPGPGARGHDLRLRGGLRLRRLPRSAAPPDAEPPGAAAHARPGLRRPDEVAEAGAADAYAAVQAAAPASTTRSRPTLPSRPPTP